MTGSLSCQQKNSPSSCPPATTRVFYFPDHAYQLLNKIQIPGTKQTSARHKTKFIIGEGVILLEPTKTIIRPSCEEGLL